MFDNIVGNALTVRRLEREIRTGTLAHAMLFVGNDYTGKLTCALETARSLNCSHGANWSCSCPSCRESRLLMNPYLFLTGPYTGMYEIRLTAELFSRNNEKANRVKLIRALRKLILRADRRFLSDEELKKIDSESLMNICSGIERINGNYFDSDENRIREVAGIVSAAEKVAEALANPCSLNTVRNLISEIYIGTEGRKFVIFEKAETLTVPVANALLKILEEPPSDTYFILITNRQNRILPTVLSRLRVYAFSDRTAEEERTVLKLFYATDERLSLSDFILKHSGWNITELDRLVDLFFSCLSAEEGLTRFYSTPELLKWSDRQLFLLFWDRLTQIVRSRFLPDGSGGNPYKHELFSCIAKILTGSRLALTEAHQSPAAVLETSFLSIRKVLEKGVSV